MLLRVICCVLGEYYFRNTGAAHFIPIPWHSRLYSPEDSVVSATHSLGDISHLINAPCLSLFTRVFLKVWDQLTGVVIAPHSLCSMRISRHSTCVGSE